MLEKIQDRIYKLSNLQLDKSYTDFILSSFSFKTIHPNFITLFGLMMDLAVLFSIKTSNIWMLGLSLFIRYSCDCLDGAVARKWNKVSDIGGLLDTIADNVLIWIISFSYLDILNIECKLLISLIPVTLNVIYLFWKKSIIHHDGIKEIGTPIHNIYRWGVNNNLVMYFLIFLVFLFTICK